MDGVTATVVPAFREAGVRAILLKGPAISSWLYTDGAPRPYGDSDLLVDPKDLSTATAVLQGLGFESKWAGTHHPGVDPDHEWQRGNEIVEPHRTLWGLETSPSHVWDVLSTMTEPLRVGGVEVDVLSPVPRTMHIALHAAQHGPGFAKPLRDLERALCQVPMDVWGEAARLADTLQGLAAFKLGLQLHTAGAELADRLGLETPPDASVEIWLQARGSRQARSIAQMARQRTLGGKVGLAAKKLLPSPTFMRVVFPRARRGRVGLTIAYVTRALWVLANTPSAGWAWLKAVREVRGSAGRPRG